MLDFRWDLLLRADRFDCDEARRLGVDSATTQSVPDPEGRGVWEARKDETTGRIFYVNHTLKKTQWHPPTPAGGAAGAPDELPAGWERRFDPGSGAGRRGQGRCTGRCTSPQTHARALTDVMPQANRTM